MFMYLYAIVFGVLDPNLSGLIVGLVGSVPGTLTAIAALRGVDRKVETAVRELTPDSGASVKDQVSSIKTTLVAHVEHMDKFVTRQADESRRVWQAIGALGARTEDY